MTTRVGSHHAWHDEDYVQDWVDRDVTDDQRRRPQLRRAAALLDLPSDQPSRVLDVGGGYGEFAAQVLETWPRARVCVQDYAAPMLELARQRLARFGDRVDYVLADLTDPDWPDRVDGPFDGAVSSLVLHNLGDPEAIGAAYAQIRKLLAPGSWFFNLDLALDVTLAPSDAPLAQLYVRADGREVERREHAHHHDLTPVGAVGLERQLALLRSAGFEHVDCLTKDLSEICTVACTGNGGFVAG